MKFSVNSVQPTWDFAQYRYDPFVDSDTKGYPVGNFTDQRTKCRVEVRRKCIRIELNIRRIIHDTNLRPVTVADIPIVTEYLQNLLASLGIVADVNNGIPSRVDLARDLSLPYKAFHFVRGVSQIYKVGHLRQRAMPELYDEPYVRFGNKQRAITFYEKESDWRVRSEVRFKTSESCRDHGFDSYRSLSDQRLQLSQWRRTNNEILNLADEIGITKSPPIASDIAERIEQVVTSKGTRLSDIAFVLAGMGGHSAIMTMFGGNCGFAKWLSALLDPTQRHRAKRVLKHVHKIAREAHWFEGISADMDIWEDYREWISDSPDNVSPSSSTTDPQTQQGA